MPGKLKPNPPGEAKQEGLAKYINRMRAVLRRSSTVKSSDGSKVPESGNSGPSQAAAPQNPTAPAQKPPPISSNAPFVISHWGSIQEEKTRALFAKYGLNLEMGDWKSSADTTVLRVAKPIRMRVRRSCHRCQTVFGPDKTCANCQHVRCKSCPRHPSTKPKDHTEAALRAILAQKSQSQGRSQRLTATTAAVAPRRKTKEPVLTLPSRTGGQDLIRKPVRQRSVVVANMFDARNALETHPNWINIQMDILEMLNLLWSHPHEPGESHGKGPQKQKLEPDPEIVRKVEERLASVKLTG
ncbi:uncharacterized protein ATNIH1004_001366 [Aspergillus tanneri]|uniref:Uncharacterized protein n=1 Tax=Aspergillus tanneri TaxID=1220188 RepID=A0A5M9MZB6_9EURO|nr:uncharacterized protein ATNIH1004_001366 [Aspergillus tanneri]KAA8652462.1 hypothetical protein ATNIH1004_001366 [Aspergillus tanneri]